MIFECSFKNTTVDNKGNDKVVTSYYIIENAETFGEVENKLYEEFGGLTGFEVSSIKISKLKEIANEKPVGDEESKIFIMTICDYFTDENGKEKELKYTVACFAKDIKDAHQFANQYIAQGLEDMELKSLKESKFIDTIK